MNTRGIASLSTAALALALAACGSSAPKAVAPSPTPAPTTESAQQVITADAAAKCTGFAAADSQVTSDTAGDVIVLDLERTVRLHARRWERMLRAATGPAGSAPEGPNKARRIAVDIARANYDTSMVALYVAAGDVARVNPGWDKVTRDLRRTRRACATV